jgi:hypothetical protein
LQAQKAGNDVIAARYSSNIRYEPLCTVTTSTSAVATSAARRLIIILVWHWLICQVEEERVFAHEETSCSNDLL